MTERIISLSDTAEIEYIDNLPIKEQYVRLKVYPFNDPQNIEFISGYTTGGSVTANGASTIRRTGSLDLVAFTEDSSPIPKFVALSEILCNNKITKIDNIISINKEVKVEMVYANNGFRYRDTQLFVIKLGTFVITDASIAHSTSGLTISLSLKDKMVRLNGEVGGIFQNAIIHSPIEDSNGNKTPVPFKSLVRAVVEDYCGIPVYDENIADIPDHNVNICYWSGGKSIYLKQFSSGSEEWVLTEERPKQGKYEPIGYGQSFCEWDKPYKYGGEIATNAGDNATAVLDKVKDLLGNYEYFFDLDGEFHFQEKKNGLNQGSIEKDMVVAIEQEAFLRDNTKVDPVYNLTTKAMVGNTNSPQYGSIKNDWIVWGKRSESELPVRYHLIAVNSIPEPTGKRYYIMPYQDKYGTLRAKAVYTSPQEGALQVIIPNTKQMKSAILQYLYLESFLENTTEFILQNQILKREIQEEVPKICDILKGNSFYGDGRSACINMDYLLELVEYEDISIQEIGWRQKTYPVEEVNCVCSTGAKYRIIQDTSEWTEEVAQYYDGYLDLSNEANQDYIKYITDGGPYAAYDYLRSVIHESVGYNNSVSVNSVPLYYLEPNVCITITDLDSDIEGQYMINSITYPLEIGGNMTINASRLVGRI